MNTRLLLIIVVVLWPGAVLSSLWLQQQSVLISFDPAMALEPALPSIKNNLTPYLNQGRDTVFHISDPACRCDSVVRKHRTDVTENAAENGFANVVVTPDSALYESIASFIPALPAIAVFHGDQLTYFGPYASGALCLSSASLVKPWLQPMSELQTRYGTIETVIPSDAQGCYCRLNQSA